MRSAHRAYINHKHNIDALFSIAAARRRAFYTPTAIGNRAKALVHIHAHEIKNLFNPCYCWKEYRTFTNLTDAIDEIDDRIKAIAAARMDIIMANAHYSIADRQAIRARYQQEDQAIAARADTQDALDRMAIVIASLPHDKGEC